MKDDFLGRQCEDEREKRAPRIEKLQESNLEAQRRQRNKQMQSSVKTIKICKAQAKNHMNTGKAPKDLHKEEQKYHQPNQARKTEPVSYWNKKVRFD